MLCGCYDFQQQIAETPNSRQRIQEASITDVPFTAWFSEESEIKLGPDFSFKEKLEEDPEFAGKTWSFKRDLLSDRMCSAVAYDGYLEIARQTKPIPQSESGCTPEVCSILFEAKFSKLAKIYEHEGD